jgi:RecA/RadA recombinase
MGMITDLYGESGSGKTQMGFTASVNCVKNGGKVLYVDTAGTFRPERIAEIAGGKSVLESITYLRALGTADQIDAMKRIPELDPDLIIVDTVTGLFSAEYAGPARHIEVMKHLRDLAIIALTSRAAVVVTNMVRNVPATIVDQAGRNVAVAVIPSQQREYLGSSVSIFSHVKVKLEIIDPKRSVFRAKLVQPPKANTVEFAITASGICDLGSENA